MPRTAATLIAYAAQSLNRGQHDSVETTLDSKPQAAQMPKRLYIADPRMVLMPISPFVINTPRKAVTNSGAELPAAIKVAPATS